MATANAYLFLGGPWNGEMHPLPGTCKLGDAVLVVDQREGSRGNKAVYLSHRMRDVSTPTAATRSVYALECWTGGQVQALLQQYLLRRWVWAAPDEVHPPA